ncbi:MAG: tyrosine-type recombinase/integrase [Candidatus Aenigmatarchaeota archaeon]
MEDIDLNYDLIKNFIKELKLNGISFRRAKKYIEIVEKYIKYGKVPKEFVLQSKDKTEYFAFKFFVEKVLGLNFENFCLQEKIKTPKFISRIDIEKILYYTKNQNHYAIICALYFAGLRLNEARLLKWKNVDFENEIIYLNGNRTIFLHPKLKDALQKLKSNNDYVFISNKGKVYDARTIQQIVTRAARRAKIKKNVTPQILRNSFAVHLLESGADIRYIQYLLGHKDMRTTQIYVYMANRNIKALAKLI